MLSINPNLVNFQQIKMPPSTHKLLLALFLSSIVLFPLSTFSKNSNSSNPTIIQCTPSLLPLASCAPFVQGIIQTPTLSCCDNLKQLYAQQPQCLCLLLSSSNLSPFTINTTLAFQLPILCKLQIDISACSEVPQGPSINPPAGSQISTPNSTATNSTVVAAAPMVQPAPRPSLMGLPFSRSAGIHLKSGGFITLFVISMIPNYLLAFLF